jgi:hypothetical protein
MGSSFFSSIKDTTDVSSKAFCSMRGLAKVETPGIRNDLLDDDRCEDLLDACKL